MDKNSRESLIYHVCTLFLKEEGNSEKIVQRLLAEEIGNIKRTNIYPLVREGVKLGFIRLVPPIDEALEVQISEKFKHGKEHIKVVDVLPETRGDHIAAAGAELAGAKIKELAKKGENKIHIGLGPGGASRAVARHLGLKLRKEMPTLKLELHAITAGCLSQSSNYAPLAFFNFFDSNMVDDAHGFFTEPIIAASQFQKQRENPGEYPGFHKAYEKRNEIQIIITSLGDASDPNDLFGAFYKENPNHGLRDLKKKKWTGNVQYRAFSEKGIINESPSTKRIATLYELNDLREIAKTKDKYVILMCSPCSGSNKTRHRALLPLLKIPELKVWSEIVTDSRTATEALQLD